MVAKQRWWQAAHAHDSTEVMFGAHLLFIHPLKKKKCYCIKLSAWLLNCLHRNDLLRVTVTHRDGRFPWECSMTVVGPSPECVRVNRWGAAIGPEAGWSTTHSRYVNKWEQWKHTLVIKKTRAWTRSSKMSAHAFRKRLWVSPSSGWTTCDIICLPWDDDFHVMKSSTWPELGAICLRGGEVQTPVNPSHLSPPLHSDSSVCRTNTRGEKFCTANTNKWRNICGRKEKVWLHYAYARVRVLCCVVQVSLRTRA